MEKYHSYKMTPGKKNAGMYPFSERYIGDVTDKK
jgi:hypothetical protein